MMHRMQDLRSLVSDLIDDHKDSDCACSRVASWLPAMLNIKESVWLGPSGAEHSQAGVIGMIGAALLMGSHALDLQLSVLEVFEQKIVIPLQSFAQQATAAAPASQPGSAAEADANADAAAAAELAASGSPCSSSQPQACQGGAAGASQPPPQQQHDEILQSVAAEITTSRIVDAVLGKARELVDSVAAVTQQLKRLKTLQALVTSTHQEKFLQQAQQLQQHLLQELTATADSHSRQMQVLFRWCIALKAVSLVTPISAGRQPPQPPELAMLSLHLLPLALAASHMQQLRLLSVLGPLDHADTSSSSSSSSSSVQLSAVAAAYMSVVPSAAEAVLCLQEALLHPDSVLFTQFMRSSSSAYDLTVLLFKASDLVPPMSLSQVIYLGSKVVHRFLQQQQQQQLCGAAAAPQGITCSSSSSSCWSAAEGLLLSRVEVLQSAAATTSHAAALLQHSSRVFEQQWRQLGYPSLTTLTQCDDRLAATLSSSSSSDKADTALMLRGMRRALTLYRVVCKWSSSPTQPNSQLRALASMVLSVASAAVGIAGAESVLLVEACNLCFTISLATLAKAGLCTPAEPAATQEVYQGPDGSSSSSGAKGAAATQHQQQHQQHQHQQQATSTSSCAVSDELLTGQLVHLVQQLVHLTPPAATSFIGKSAAANRESTGGGSSGRGGTDSISCSNNSGTGCSSSSSSNDSGSNPGSSSSSGGSHGGGSGSGGGCSNDCDADDGRCIHTIIISNLRVSVLQLAGMLEVLLGTSGSLGGAAVVPRMHQPSYLQQLSCVLQGMEAAVRVLVPLLLAPANRYVISTPQQGEGVSSGNEQPRILYPSTKEIIMDASTMSYFEQLSALLVRTTCAAARLTGLLEASGGVEVLTETVPGQQLLQAWLSLQATTSKDYTLICVQSANTPCYGPSTALQERLTVHLTRQLDAALAAQEVAQKQQQIQQRQQRQQQQSSLQQPPQQSSHQQQQQPQQQQAQQSSQQQQQQQQPQQQQSSHQQQPPPQQQQSSHQQQQQPPQQQSSHQRPQPLPQQPSYQQELQAAQLPDPQLVSVVLMQAAHYHFHLAEELGCIRSAVEGAARDCNGDGHPAPGIFARVKQVAEFFASQDESRPKSALLKTAKPLQQDNFARYSASVQGLLSALISLVDAVAGSPGGLQTSSSQDMMQQLPPGQGAAGAQAAASSSCREHACVLQQPDRQAAEQLVQQWAAVVEAWQPPGAMLLEQLLQADARLLQATVASAAVHVQEWQQFVEQATGAQGASAAAGPRRRTLARQTSKQRKPLSLPLPVEKVLGAMKALEGVLLGRARLLSVLIPSRYCCNNLGCGNMAGPSESFYLVRGRSCVCGGCVSQQLLDDGAGHTLAARYCCVTCQKAAYGTHKLACRAARTRDH